VGGLGGREADRGSAPPGHEDLLPRGGALHAVAEEVAELVGADGGGVGG
jgi:hypothetical protein